ncbi:MAG: polysaccharide deacetylase family protein [Oscillospiraceae bacterium]|nr:polysaccharide deacetylase family protein [Oscillospiraceae bacterium]
MSVFRKDAGHAKKEKNRKTGGKTLPVFLSPVRRIERVAVRERICAMTFDDGPCALPAVPDHFRGKALTLVLAETLERYGAKGTFNIIGDTAGSYPDRAGRTGTPSWNGTAYDHFPDIGQDSRGGALHCPELIGRLLAGGHEIANHSYSHLLFGWSSLAQGQRKSQKDLDQVVADLRRLHQVMESGWRYPMRLGRPPRCADAVRGGFSSYDAYALLGYQYLAASFDGAGRQPLRSYEAEVEAAWRPMEALLLEDPDAFCGQIIALKDGYNMARRTPVADGLERQLRLLTDLGYRVVTASELLERSAFRDVLPEDPAAGAARQLLGRGWCVVFQDNTLRPGAALTRGELAMMAFGRETVRRRIELVRSGRAPFRDMEPRHPYAAAAAQAVEAGAMSAVKDRFRPDAHVSPAELGQFCAARLGRTPPLEDWTELTHGEFFRIAAGL